MQVGRTVINFSVKAQGLTKHSSDAQSTAELGALDVRKEEIVGAMGVVKANSKTAVVQ